MTFDGEGKKMFTFRAKEVGQKQISTSENAWQSDKVVEFSSFYQQESQAANIFREVRKADF